MDRAGFGKKWIGLLLAAAMILSGICLELGQADSLFLCADSAGSAPEVYCIKAMVSDYEASCTSEQLGLKSVQAMAGSERSAENNVRIVWSLFFLAVLPQIQTKIQKENKKNPECASAGRRCIIRYIHRQDGEKGISVIS